MTSEGGVLPEAWGGVKNIGFGKVFSEVFHVKHFKRAGAGNLALAPHQICLFADTEVPENRVQDILNVNSAGKAAKRASGQSQFFSEQVFATLPDHPAALGAAQPAHPQGLADGVRG